MKWKLNLKPGEVAAFWQELQVYLKSLALTPAVREVVDRYQASPVDVASLMYTRLRLLSSLMTLQEGLDFSNDDLVASETVIAALTPAGFDLNQQCLLCLGESSPEHSCR
jgi:hypothetical protein